MGYWSRPSSRRTSLLAHAGAWTDRRARNETRSSDGRRPRALIGSIPVAYAFDALTFPHMLVVAFLDRYSRRALPRLPQLACTRHRAARAAPRGRLTHARQPRVLVCRRAERGGLLVQALSAPARSSRCRLVRRVRAVPPLASTSSSPSTEAPGKGHVVAGVRWVVRLPDRPGGPRGDGDDQLLQLMFVALFVLYATVARKSSRGRSGSCSAPERSEACSARSSPAAWRAGSASGRFAVGGVIFPAPLLLVPLAAGQWVVLGACSSPSSGPASA